MTSAENQLIQLSRMTEIVADTGEIEQIKKLKPTDATTNPSLLYKAAQMKEYDPLLRDAIEYSNKLGGNKQIKLENAMDKLAINFGCEILKITPGVVSIEIDARLSFNVNDTISKVKKLIKICTDMGINARKRILFKLASTWEGLQSMKILQK